MDPAHASQEYQADRDAYSSKVPMDPVLRSAMKLRVSTQRASDEAKWFSYAVPSREAFVAAADRRGIKDYDNAWKSGAVMQGWLYKRGKIRKSWKRRFFVLRGTRLEYFKSVTAIKPKGSIDLEDVVHKSFFDSYTIAKLRSSWKSSTIGALSKSQSEKAEAAEEKQSTDNSAGATSSEEMFPAEKELLLHSKWQTSLCIALWTNAKKGDGEASPVNPSPPFESLADAKDKGISRVFCLCCEDLLSYLLWKLHLSHITDMDWHGEWLDILSGYRRQTSALGAMNALLSAKRLSTTFTETAVLAAQIVIEQEFRRKMGMERGAHEVELVEDREWKPGLSVRTFILDDLILHAETAVKVDVYDDFSLWKALGNQRRAWASLLTSQEDVSADGRAKSGSSKLRSRASTSSSIASRDSDLFYDTLGEEEVPQWLGLEAPLGVLVERCGMRVLVLPKSCGLSSDGDAGRWSPESPSRGPDAAERAISALSVTQNHGTINHSEWALRLTAKGAGPTVSTEPPSLMTDLPKQVSRSARLIQRSPDTFTVLSPGALAPALDSRASILKANSVQFRPEFIRKSWAALSFPVPPTTADSVTKTRSGKYYVETVETVARAETTMSLELELVPWGAFSLTALYDFHITRGEHLSYQQTSSRSLAALQTKATTGRIEGAVSSSKVYLGGGIGRSFLEDEYSEDIALAFSSGEQRALALAQILEPTVHRLGINMRYLGCVRTAAAAFGLGEALKGEGKDFHSITNISFADLKAEWGKMPRASTLLLRDLLTEATARTAKHFFLIEVRAAAMEECKQDGAATTQRRKSTGWIAAAESNAWKVSSACVTKVWKRLQSQEGRDMVLQCFPHVLFSDEGLSGFLPEGSSPCSRRHVGGVDWHAAFARFGALTGIRISLSKVGSLSDMRRKSTVSEALTPTLLEEAIIGADAKVKSWDDIDWRLAAAATSVLEQNVRQGAQPGVTKADTARNSGVDDLQTAADAMCRSLRACSGSSMFGTRLQVLKGRAVGLACLGGEAEADGFRRALLYHERAIEEDPENEEALLAAADACQALDEEQSAQEWWLKCLLVSPSCESAVRRWARGFGGGWPLAGFSTTTMNQRSSVDTTLPQRQSDAEDMLQSPEKRRGSVAQGLDAVIAGFPVVDDLNVAAFTLQQCMREKNPPQVITGVDHVAMAKGSNADRVLPVLRSGLVEAAFQIVQDERLDGFLATIALFFLNRVARLLISVYPEEEVDSPTPVVAGYGAVALPTLRLMCDVLLRYLELARNIGDSALLYTSTDHQEASRGPQPTKPDAVLSAQDTSASETTKLAHSVLTPRTSGLYRVLLVAPIIRIASYCKKVRGSTPWQAIVRCAGELCNHPVVSVKVVAFGLLGAAVRDFETCEALAVTQPLPIRRWLVCAESGRPSLRTAAITNLRYLFQTAEGSHVAIMSGVVRWVARRLRWLAKLMALEQVDSVVSPNSEPALPVQDARQELKLIQERLCRGGKERVLLLELLSWVVHGDAGTIGPRAILCEDLWDQLLTLSSLPDHVQQILYILMQLSGGWDTQQHIKAETGSPSDAEVISGVIASQKSIVKLVEAVLTLQTPVTLVADIATALFTVAGRNLPSPRKPTGSRTSRAASGSVRSPRVRSSLTQLLPIDVGPILAASRSPLSLAWALSTWLHMYINPSGRRHLGTSMWLEYLVLDQTAADASVSPRIIHVLENMAKETPSLLLQGDVVAQWVDCLWQRFPRLPQAEDRQRSPSGTNSPRTSISQNEEYGVTSFLSVFDALFPLLSTQVNHFPSVDKLVALDGAMMLLHKFLKHEIRLESMLWIIVRLVCTEQGRSAVFNERYGIAMLICGFLSATAGARAAGAPVNARSLLSEGAVKIVDKQWQEFCKANADHPGLEFVEAVDWEKVAEIGAAPARVETVETYCIWICGRLCYNERSTTQLLAAAAGIGVDVMGLWRDCLKSSNRLLSQRATVGLKYLASHPKGQQLAVSSGLMALCWKCAVGLAPEAGGGGAAVSVDGGKAGEEEEQEATGIKLDHLDGTALAEVPALHPQGVCAPLLTPDAHLNAAAFSPEEQHLKALEAWSPINTTALDALSFFCWMSSRQLLRDLLLAVAPTLSRATALIRTGLQCSLGSSDNQEEAKDGDSEGKQMEGGKPRMSVTTRRVAGSLAKSHRFEPQHVVPLLSLAIDVWGVGIIAACLAPYQQQFLTLLTGLLEGKQGDGVFVSLGARLLAVLYPAHLQFDVPAIPAADEDNGESIEDSRLAVRVEDSDAVHSFLRIIQSTLVDEGNSWLGVLAACAAGVTVLHNPSFTDILLTNVPHLLPGIVQNEGDLKLLPSGSHPQVHQFKSLVFDLMRKVVQQHGASHR